jgi:hypothetical protein
MKENEPYPFQFIGGVSNTYGFITSSKASFEIKFKPSGYLFGDEVPFADYTYEFVILSLNDDYVKFNPDSRISATVSEIVYDFFKLKERTVIYICENRDGRGKARDRKFNHWFSLYNRLFLVKMDFVLGYETNPYLTSLIIRIDNPYMDEILKATAALFEEHKK